MIQDRTFEAYERALMSEQPVLTLRAAVKAMVDAGRPRDKVQAELEGFALALREQHRPGDEDAVVDVLDFLVGWCSPHMKI